MKHVNKNQITFLSAFILGTIIITGIFLATDFLYAGVQEKLFTNVYPGYEPNIELANKVIIACSITIICGLCLYVLIAWMISRKERIKRLIKEEEIIDHDESLNFRAFQVEISSSMRVLRDLFVYLITLVIFSGLFSFLRFIWVFSKYRSYNQLFIEYYLANLQSMFFSITLYLALAIMINYIVLISLQKYRRLQIIAKSYEDAMEKVLDNFDRLME